MPHTRTTKTTDQPFIDLRIGGFHLILQQPPHRLATFLISLTTIAGSLSGIAWLNQ